ncbi:MAG: helix-turn-helix transcriptional regulator [Lachnospiraceae bacterium]|nr:helix-turn-helix transcriptional regulator [Lachnospiraceae bacterium]
MVRREYDFHVIGKNLKKLRLMNKMTAEDVREYMQLGTVQAVYKWERGDCLPQADSLLALMELYGVNTIDRITGVSTSLAPVPLFGAPSIAA